MDKYPSHVRTRSEKQRWTRAQKADVLLSISYWLRRYSNDVVIRKEPDRTVMATSPFGRDGMVYFSSADFCWWVKWTTRIHVPRRLMEDRLRQCGAIPEERIETVRGRRVTLIDWRFPAGMVVA